MWGRFLDLSTAVGAVALAVAFLAFVWFLIEVAREWWRETFGGACDAGEGAAVPPTHPCRPVAGTARGGALRAVPPPHGQDGAA